MAETANSIYKRGWEAGWKAHADDFKDKILNSDRFKEALMMIAGRTPPGFDSKEYAKRILGEAAAQLKRRPTWPPTGS